jgi:hypothetical protein
MERVWKRVALSRRRHCKDKAAEEAARRPSCYRVAAATPVDKVARDFMWCDLVATGSDSPQSPPPEAVDGRPEPPPRNAPAPATVTKTFSLNLDSRLVMELNPKALTKRFCSRAARRSKKQDNELYRSNSFHFKRYERPHQDEADNQVGCYKSFCSKLLCRLRIR